jgi:hypothetical protein
MWLQYVVLQLQGESLSRHVATKTSCSSADLERATLFQTTLENLTSPDNIHNASLADTESERRLYCSSTTNIGTPENPADLQETHVGSVRLHAGEGPGLLQVWRASRCPLVSP